MNKTSNKKLKNGHHPVNEEVAAKLDEIIRELERLKKAIEED